MDTCLLERSCRLGLLHHSLADIGFCFCGSCSFRSVWHSQDSGLFVCQIHGYDLNRLLYPILLNSEVMWPTRFRPPMEVERLPLELVAYSSYAVSFCVVFSTT